MKLVELVSLVSLAIRNEYFEAAYGLSASRRRGGQWRILLAG